MTSQLRWQSVAKGLGTLVPVLGSKANSVAGDPVSARYFYTVWLRHLTRINEARPGFAWDVVAELGPGDALGIAMCALLSGAKRYVGLDRLAFGLRADNLRMLDELHALFSARSPIPDDTEFPGVYPKLSSYVFPIQVLDDARLQVSLSPSHLDRLRLALQGDMGFAEDNLISYAAPWDENNQIQRASVDLLLSQAVLEHVDNVDDAYAGMRSWLKPSGLMSHRIDYTCHGITHDWYGHWTVSPSMWRVVRGKRAYLINRLPHSAHLAALARAGFDVMVCDPTAAPQPAPANQVLIAHQPADLRIQGAFLVLRPGSP